MKTRVLLAILGAAVMLSACEDEKSSLETKIEQGEAVSRKMGDVSNIPRVTMPPEKKKGGNDGR